MPVEFIGMIGARPGSETARPRGPAIDHDYLRGSRGRTRSRLRPGAHRLRVLAARRPAGRRVRAAHTERLAFLIAHRPGFVAPDGGRARVRDARPAHARAHRRARHLRRQRRRAAPRRRHAGQGRALRAHRRVPPDPRPGLAVGDAVRLRRAGTTRSRTSSARSARTSSRGSPCTSAARRRRRSRSARGMRTCSRSGASRSRRPPSRSPGRGPPRRPRAATSRRASASRSARSSATPTRRRGSARTASSRPRRRTSTRPRAIGKRFGLASGAPENAGSQRLLAAAPSAASCTTGRCGRRSPRPSARYGNTTALVGSPETVAQALLDYVDIGVTTLLIRGFDPVEDAVDYGRRAHPARAAGGRTPGLARSCVGVAARRERDEEHPRGDGGRPRTRGRRHRVRHPGRADLRAVRRARAPRPNRVIVAPRHEQAAAYMAFGYAQADRPAGRLLRRAGRRRSSTPRRRSPPPTARARRPVPHRRGAVGVHRRGPGPSPRAARPAGDDAHVTKWAASASTIRPRRRRWWPRRCGRCRSGRPRPVALADAVGRLRPARGRADGADRVTGAPPPTRRRRDRRRPSCSRAPRQPIIMVGSGAQHASAGGARARRAPAGAGGRRFAAAAGSSPSDHPRPHLRRGYDLGRHRRRAGDRLADGAALVPLGAGARRA